MKERSASLPEDCWNVEALYQDFEAWEKEFQKLTDQGKRPYFSNLSLYQGKLAKGAEQLRQCLDTFFAIDRHLSKLYTYAHLRHDEDVGAELAKNALLRATSLLHAFREEGSWIEPEILSLSEKVMDSYLKEQQLQLYHLYLQRILRLKKHTLSLREEALLALGGNALGTAERTFGNLNNADLRFPKICDSQGNAKELSHGSYQVYMTSTDRTLRKEAFLKLHQTFGSFENTFAELLQGQVQSHHFHAKARYFPTCLDASLFPKEIATTVYHNLIQAVHHHLPKMHRYISLRKKILGYDTLHLYDLSVPLTPDVKIEMKYEEAVSVILDSLQIMGEEYLTILKKGLNEERWVDRYENKQKRSGAYSSGCFDSMPYILMNYHGIFNDVMTLTHEAGHSMHSWYTRKHQPYPYAHYEIFLAEVASTFHESLLLEHLIQKAKDPKVKAYLLTQKIDRMRSTLIRQTQFAEFELLLHKLVEQEEPITATRLKTEYRKLNAAYFGPDLLLDPESDWEWARIPHFYYGFYVYQYATGISAAQILAERVLSGDKKAKSDYIQFLSAGSSDSPLEILRKGGVDMETPAAVETSMQHFGSLVDQLALTLGSV